MKAFIILAAISLVSNTLAIPVNHTDEQLRELAHIQAEVYNNATASVGQLKFTEDQIFESLKLTLSCFEKLTPEEIRTVAENDFANQNENVKCYFACHYENDGYIKNGVLQEDSLVKEWSIRNDKQKAQAIINQCKHIHNKNRCEQAFQFNICFTKAQKEILKD